MKTGSFNQNSTYIRNPGFPTTTTEAATITYTVNKASSDVCNLRLDLETFDLRGPTAITDAEAAKVDSCPDKMTIAVSTVKFVILPALSYRPQKGFLQILAVFCLLEI